MLSDIFGDIMQNDHFRTLLFFCVVFALFAGLGTYEMCRAKGWELKKKLVLTFTVAAITAVCTFFLLFNPVMYQPAPPWEQGNYGAALNHAAPSPFSPEPASYKDMLVSRFGRKIKT